MSVSRIDLKLFKFISLLSCSQKKLLLIYSKELLKTGIIGKRQTIAEYNSELDQAMENVKNGNFTTLKDLEKEMESW